MAVLEADFSGWATKAGLECSDGRTIMQDAFKDQDKVKVPLVYMHGHTNPENVVGHALLTNKPEGVWVEAFFNNTQPATHLKETVEHGDITQLSIWANGLVQQGKKVFHGMIREVSLVLAGANPGALIQNVNLRHGDDSLDVLEEEAIIYTGLPFEHIAHADVATGDPSEITLRDVYETMDQKQKDVLHFLVAEAASGSLAQSMAEGTSFKELYDSLTDEQKIVLHANAPEAFEKAGVVHTDTDGTDDADATGTDDAGTDDAGTDDADATGTDDAGTDDAGTDTPGTDETGTEDADAPSTDADEAAGTDTDADTGTDSTDESKGNDMKHSNIFENTDASQGPVISHSDIEGIVGDAMKASGKLSDHVKEYALAHGIQDIDVLFPEARTLADSPELFSRRSEWVSVVMAKVRKSPFSRIKTISADLTPAQARAKGYITGTLKKEEFFKVSKRTTFPTTIYKKQKLDRDDVVDITDFDVVSWLKGEMRLMLDEELARAILLGDGRASNDEDKVDEECIRPVAYDHELYTHVVNVNLGDASSSIREVSDAIVRNRRHLRGSGMPTMFTTESTIAEFMLLRDGVNRNLYTSLDQLAAELRVESIVPVEVMEEYTDLVAVLVNLNDYVVGADKGGNVSMFDDFDIDYNQLKYLIETRASGALVKLRSALVVKKVAGSAVLVTPTAPTFNGSAVTIVNTANVVYRNADTDAVINAAGSPYAVAEGESMNIVAEPAAGYYFADSEADDWSFTNEG